MIWKENSMQRPLNWRPFIMNWATSIRQSPLVFADFHFDWLCIFCKDVSQSSHRLLWVRYIYFVFNFLWSWLKVWRLIAFENFIDLLLEHWAKAFRRAAEQNDTAATFKLRGKKFGSDSLFTVNVTLWTVNIMSPKQWTITA